MPLVWPASLPQKLIVDGYGETPGNNVIMNEPDVGPPMMRRRATSAITFIKGQQLLTISQFKNHLRVFYFTTTACGTLDFDGLHPVTQEACSMIFLGPYQVAGYETSNNGYPPRIRVEYQFGILP